MNDLGTTFSVVFKKLAVLQETDEAKQSNALAEEAEEIQELRRIIEEDSAPDCFEFATS